MFKSLKSFILKCLELKKRTPFLFYPDNSMKTTWELCMYCLLIFSCLITPVQLALYTDLPDGWVWSNRVTDLLFLCDIFVVFNSAFYDDDLKLVEDRWKICYSYLTGWFLIDFVCIIPFDMLF